MKSSFTRRGPAPRRDPSTRPGPYGQTLVSTGLADFDRLLGGGLPLGCLLLVLEDAPPALAKTLLRYFLAEGAAAGQACHWAAPADAADGTGEEAWLPALVLPPKPGSHLQASEAAAPQQEDHLRIAWQYRKYMNGGVNAANARHPPQHQPNRSNGAGPVAVASVSVPAASSAAQGWCHSFDLSQPQPAAEAPHLGMRQHTPGEGAAELAAAAAAFASRLAECGGGSGSSSSGAGAAEPAAAGGARIGRIAVQSLGWGASPSGTASNVHRSDGDGDICGGSASATMAAAADASTAGAGADNAAAATLAPADGGSAGEDAPAPAPSAADAGHVLRALHALKRMARSSRCVVMVSVPAGRFDRGFATALQHVADAAVALEAISQDAELLRIVPEPDTCRGMLRVVKLPAVGALAAPEPESELLLPVDVDPDAADALLEESQAQQDGGDVKDDDLDDDESDSVNTIGLGSAGGDMLCGGGGGSRPAGAANPFDF